MTFPSTQFVATNDTWNQFWTDGAGHWLATKGLHIALVVLFALLTTRVLRWAGARMGVESIEKDIVNLRVVARTLPGKQFEVGRRLRALIVTALRREGVATAEATTTPVG